MRKLVPILLVVCSVLLMAVAQQPSRRSKATLKLHDFTTGTDFMVTGELNGDEVKFSGLPPTTFITTLDGKQVREFNPTLPAALTADDARFLALIAFSPSHSAVPPMERPLSMDSFQNTLSGKYAITKPPERDGVIIIQTDSGLLTGEVVPGMMQGPAAMVNGLEWRRQVVIIAFRARAEQKQ